MNPKSLTTWAPLAMSGVAMLVSFTRSIIIPPATLDERMSEVEKSIKSLSPKVYDIHGLLSAVHTKVTDLQSTSRDLKKDMHGIRSDLNDLRKSLNKDSADLKVAVATLTADQSHKQG